ncbi:MAG: hypothetical protein A2017_17170 [Lentisphaerae bacterium GWF2_44_16]|nr:MAG: hypothetical protein A2017_17170 [Lentisphaerae bacterium GWF2_44_16]
MNVSSALSSTSNVTNVDSDIMMTSEDFYALLVAEVTNQDPTNPMSNQELTLQLMQLQNTQSMNSVSENLQDLIDEASSYTDMLSSLATTSSLTSVNSMLGRNISYTDPDTEESVSGTITGITIEGGTTYFVVDGTTNIVLDDITSISSN